MGYLLYWQQVWHCRKQTLFLFPQPYIIKKKGGSRMSYESRRDDFICLMFILARIPQRSKSSARGSDGAWVWSWWSSAESNLQVSIYMDELRDNSRSTVNPKRQKWSLHGPNVMRLFCSCLPQRLLSFTHTHSSKEQFQSFSWQLFGSVCLAGHQLGFCLQLVCLQTQWPLSEINRDLFK